MKQATLTRQLELHDPVATLIDSLSENMATQAMAPVHDRLAADHRAYVARLDAALGLNPSLQERSK